MTQQTLYTVTVYSENQVGLLNQISIIFTRRQLNIESQMCIRDRFIIPFEREKVEFVLDVFHTVDVSIQIYIVISHRIDYCIFVMYIAYSRLLFDGTCFVRYVLGDIFELTYIYRCATIQIDNDPNRAGISAGRAVLSQYGEVSR